MPEIFDASELKASHDEEVLADQESDETVMEAEATPAPQPTAEKPKRNVDAYSDVMREEEPSQNPFDAFAPKPLQVFFDTQDREEHILLLLRKHP
ncbi:MAG TPA: hypothetical protein VF209_00305, partial [Patescibacteria group bacterium]